MRREARALGLTVEQVFQMGVVCAQVGLTDPGEVAPKLAVGASLKANNLSDNQLRIFLYLVNSIRKEEQ